MQECKVEQCPMLRATLPALLAMEESRYAVQAAEIAQAHEEKTGQDAEEWIHAIFDGIKNKSDDAMCVAFSMGCGIAIGSLADSVKHLNQEFDNGVTLSDLANTDIAKLVERELIQFIGEEGMPNASQS